MGPFVLMIKDQSSKFKEQISDRLRRWVYEVFLLKSSKGRKFRLFDSTFELCSLNFEFWHTKIIKKGGEISTPFLIPPLNFALWTLNFGIWTLLFEHFNVIQIWSEATNLNNIEPLPRTSAKSQPPHPKPSLCRQHRNSRRLLFWSSCCK